MIELVERKTILDANQVFGKFIVDLQNTIYNPLSGAEFDELEDWEKESLEEFERNKDWVTFSEKLPDYVGEFVFTFDGISSANEYAEALSVKIKSLFEKLSWKKVYFLLDYNIPWLSQENSFPPVQKALTYLQKLGLDQDFSGSIVADVNEIQELILSVFWLGRCNAGLPLIYFSGENSKVIFHICKHGNLHLECYDEDERNFIQEILKQFGFRKVSICDEFLEDTGAITGREILV